MQGDLAPDSLSNSMGLFLQKTNIIRDYLEGINEIPKSRMFWPREIWSKYADKLEDFKYEENSEKVVQCLNDMVMNALIHAEDCLKYMVALKDNAIFRFCAIPGPRLWVLAIRRGAGLCQCQGTSHSSRPQCALLVFRGVCSQQLFVVAGVEVRKLWCCVSSGYLMTPE